MREVEHKVLSDAIRTAIKAEKTVIKQRRIICVLSVALIACVGGAYGQDIAERLLGVRR